MAPLSNDEAVNNTQQISCLLLFEPFGNMRDFKKDSKRLDAIISELSESYVIVEGIKDAFSMKKIGVIAKTNTEQNIKNAYGNVVVLTDLDRTGEELATQIAQKLRENTKVNKVDVRTRKILSGILNLKRFEEIDKKLEKFKEVCKDG